MNRFQISTLACMFFLAPWAQAGLCDASSYRRTVMVSNASQLTDALKAARPGDLIQLAAGTYAGAFVASQSGTETSPIALCGPRSAILRGSSTSKDYGFHLNASHWILSGFQITNAKKGVILDSANYNILDNLEVSYIGEEAIHLRLFSTNNIVQKNSVHDTGLLTPGYGEGLYVGSAVSNWCTYTNCKPDKSDDNKFLENWIYNTAAESLDIKEGTTGTVVEGNTFDGTKMTGANYADSWIDVKGNNVIVRNNIGLNSGKVMLDGYQTHVIEGYGQNIIFSGNKSQVNGKGYGIWVHQDSKGVAVDCDNTFQSALSGLSNLRCEGSSAPVPTPVPAPSPKPTPQELNFASMNRVIRSTVLRADQTLSHLFDGCTNDNTDCMIGTDKSEIFEVELDLGEKKSLKRVELFGDANGKWLSESFDVEVKDEGASSYRSLASKISAKKNAWIMTSVNASARYVRIRVRGKSGSKAVQVRELRIIGLN